MTLAAGIAGILLLLGLLALRLPIGIAMAGVGLLGFSLLTGGEAGFSLLGLATYQTVASYPLTVIPLFLFMGQIAGEARLGRDLYQALHRWLGPFPGGLAMATIAACAAFAAVSGSSLATAAIMGRVALPEMKRFGYDDSLAAGSVAAGGTLGILIPPSTVMIIYAMLTGQPVGRLFVAGILPGIVLTLLFGGAILLQVRRNPRLGPRGPVFPLRERVRALGRSWSVLVLFLLVIGGLYAGWFTPTEAAGMGAAGALVIVLLSRRLNWVLLGESLRETVMTTAMIFMVLVGANLFSAFMTVTQWPETLTGWAATAGWNRYLLLAVMAGVYILLGCFLEGLAIMVLTLPVAFPLITTLGFDPIWFGVLITLFMEMSLITPPVGMNVFVIKGVAPGIPLPQIFRGVTPFFLAMVALMILLLAFPSLALFLPDRMAR